MDGKKEEGRKEGGKREEEYRINKSERERERENVREMKASELGVDGGLSYFANPLELFHLFVDRKYPDGRSGPIIHLESMEEVEWWHGGQIPSSSMPSLATRDPWTMPTRVQDQRNAAFKSSHW